MRHDLPGNHKRDYSKHSNDEMRVAQREEQSPSPAFYQTTGQPVVVSSMSIKGTARLVRVGQP